MVDMAMAMAYAAVDVVDTAVITGDGAAKVCEVNALLCISHTIVLLHYLTNN